MGNTQHPNNQQEKTHHGNVSCSGRDETAQTAQPGRISRGGRAQQKKMTANDDTVEGQEGTQPLIAALYEGGNADDESEQTH